MLLGPIGKSQSKMPFKLCAHWVADHRSLHLSDIIWCLGAQQKLRWQQKQMFASQFYQTYIFNFKLKFIWYIIFLLIIICPSLVQLVRCTLPTPRESQISAIRVSEHSFYWNSIPNRFQIAWFQQPVSALYVFGFFFQIWFFLHIQKSHSNDENIWKRGDKNR